MDCPKCASGKFAKARFVRDRQRFKCKECNYLYTVSEKSTAKPMAMKRFALHLYLEGMGFRWRLTLSKGNLHSRRRKNLSVRFRVEDEGGAIEGIQ